MSNLINYGKYRFMLVLLIHLHVYFGEYKFIINK